MSSSAPEGINLRMARPDDCRKVAELHRDNIPGGFLSSLGASVLEYMYKAVVSYKKSFCVVADDGDNIAGFAAGTTDMKGLYLRFLVRGFPMLWLVLLGKMLRPGNITKMIETIMYPGNVEEELPGAELISIAVEPGHRRKGLGGSLLQAVSDEFKKRGEEAFRVSVGGALSEAREFYERNGGELATSVRIHGDRESIVYVWRT